MRLGSEFEEIHAIEEIEELRIEGARRLGTCLLGCVIEIEEIDAKR